jgi:hypothetical protein
MRPTSSSRELRIIAASLQSIHAALGRLAPALDARRRSPAGDIPQQPPSSKRKLKLSPARRAALKLQGQYMGYMRGLKPAQKNRVKAVAATKGIAAAVVIARKLAQG